jgi:hypothetical protein
MAKQTINIGTNPNDGTGDTLRAAGGKINDNFTELYNSGNSSSSVANTANVTAQAAFNSANLFANIVLTKLTNQPTYNVSPTTDKVLLVSADTVGANVFVNLPTVDATDGKEYVIKNLSSATNYNISIGLADGPAGYFVQAADGSFQSSSNLSVTGATAHYVYDDQSSAYRLLDYYVDNDSVSLLVLKSVVADSTSFADFQTRIAAL